VLLEEQIDEKKNKQDQELAELESEIAEE